MSGVQRTQVLCFTRCEIIVHHVPVQETIRIVLQNVYHHKCLPPPKTPEMIMGKLLIICTTEASFCHMEGHVYMQTNGVSMGSPLGPH